MSGEGEEKSPQQIAFEKTIGGSTGQPRSIKARTGQATDPLPAGKKLEEKEFPNLTPAKHDGAGNTGEELSKEDVKAHKAELKAMQGGDAKHGGASSQPVKHVDAVKGMGNIGTSKEPKTR